MAINHDAVRNQNYHSKFIFVLCLAKVYACKDFPLCSDLLNTIMKHQLLKIPSCLGMLSYLLVLLLSKEVSCLSS